MKIYSDPRLLALGVVGGTVSRHAGNMRERPVQDAFFEKLDIPSSRILRLHQVHGDHILPILTPEQAAHQQTITPLSHADGWILRPKGFGAAVLTADCVPLFLWDKEADLVALVHAGWRGVAQLLPQQTALEMQALGAKGPLQAFLGPHIQKCCFEVQEDTAQQFPHTCWVRQNGKLFIDLTLEIRRQLQEAGLTEDAVYAPDFCTCGNAEQFFSWRRDHLKQNLLSFIYKP